VTSDHNQIRGLECSTKECHLDRRPLFNNECYPALIPVHDKIVLLHKAVRALIQRGALDEHDQEISDIIECLAGEWFVVSE
jgi:hypothetical protein